MRLMWLLRHGFLIFPSESSNKVVKIWFFEKQIPNPHLKSPLVVIKSSGRVSCGFLCESQPPKPQNSAEKARECIIMSDLLLLQGFQSVLIPIKPREKRLRGQIRGFNNPVRTQNPSKRAISGTRDFRPAILTVSSFVSWQVVWHN